MRQMKLRLALKLRIGQRLAEADRGKINLRDVALALGVSERTLRNWKTQAKKEIPRMGRPPVAKEKLDQAREIVFAKMDEQGAPGWRPVAESLKGKVSVRLVQKFVAEYKQLNKTKKIVKSKIEVKGKNVVWSMDGAITKENNLKVENQVIKDRGSRFWVGLGQSRIAAKSKDVIDLLEKSFKDKGKPLVIATDNGPAYKSKTFEEYLKNNKIIHLKSLPHTPQHNGAVEVGIRELRHIMEFKEISLKSALNCANKRLRRYGKTWLKAEHLYKEENVLYTEGDRELFFKTCEEHLNSLAGQSLSFRQKKLEERKVIYRELEQRGYLTQWKMVKDGV